MLVVFAVLFYLSEQLEDNYHMKGIAKGATLSIRMAVLCLTSYVTGKITDYVLENNLDRHRPLLPYR
ncbi:hypothetical protein Back11_20980 [Paenibacillus baekrokdamisoli]|uniref:Uncharacterized protein n=1 Tax=Paenibacillus baekrokdamisoli TaxID=1712516 RepID=A0A3G9J7B8_9BACL|nr:hypothetical protein [Paenibacillus baekrokdamisoli]BBH20753.1 hypothetical protein Back11_20980 [Paenibacillus baekrokdamisoli]